MAKGAKRTAQRATAKRAGDAADAPTGPAPAQGLALNALESHLREAANILRGSP